MGDFSSKVFAVVRQIPEGSVSTYGQVARLIGSPRSARFVGYALHANPDPGAEVNHIPCHRVVFKDGSLCKGYAFGGPGVQRKMLEDEGVSFSDHDHVDMKSCSWNGLPDAPSREHDFPTEPPSDFDWESELGEG